VAGFHDHDACPLESAICVVASAVLPERLPLAYRTLTVHWAPAMVLAVTVVKVPSEVGFGFTVTVTVS
jgi:hypothetical protein